MSLKIEIIHQDAELIVIHKPAGAVVNRAESVREQTVQDWMEDQYPSSFERLPSDQNASVREFVNRSGVVHRLDKETSGVMVLAKNVECFVELKRQFKQRLTHKHYIALVHGKVEPKQGTIHLPLARNPLNRRRFTVAVDGKVASTQYEVKQHFQNPHALTLVHLFPTTGRTHQLRVHLSYLGYPMVSDSIYLGKRLKEDLIWCPRLFLHAHALSFIHPQTHKRVAYICELASDLKEAMKKLGI